jgi:hypothetical protein
MNRNASVNVETPHTVANIDPMNKKIDPIDSPPSVEVTNPYPAKSPRRVVVFRNDQVKISLTDSAPSLSTQYHQKDRYDEHQ